jgi:tetratricopeptide (TPR) repeat protein
VLALTALLTLISTEPPGSSRSPLNILTAEVTRTPIDSGDPLSRPYATLARAFARVGGVTQARRLLAEMDAQAPDSLLGYAGQFDRAWAGGTVALAEGDVAHAILQLRRASDGPCNVCALPDLARAYDLSRSTDSALAVYERYVNAYSISRVEIDPLALAQALRRLGELYEDRGDRRKALLYYEQFTSLYRTADPELQPLVSDVKGRIARLLRKVG